MSACLNCGAPTGPRARVCGPRCAARWGARRRRYPLTCEQCGVVFWRKKKTNAMKDARRFCSRACAYRHGGPARAAAQSPGARAARAAQAIAYALDRTIARDLARAAQAAVPHTRRRPRGESADVDHLCPDCGSLFRTTGSDDVFCSHRCARRYRRKGDRYPNLGLLPLAARNHAASLIALVRHARRRLNAEMPGYNKALLFNDLPGVG